MATRYKLYANTTDGQVINSIKRILDDGTVSSIPKNEANIDYQEYLEWVAEGNTPEAAD
jgi:hypothetical protein|tara:strand:+ start:1038 stop:1214 length:177 start_codon:yes stop_codon:yes gene_type:complete